MKRLKPLNPWANEAPSGRKPPKDLRRQRCLAPSRGWQKFAGAFLVFPSAVLQFLYDVGIQTPRFKMKGLGSETLHAFFV